MQFAIFKRSCSASVILNYWTWLDIKIYKEVAFSNNIISNQKDLENNIMGAYYFIELNAILRARTEDKVLMYRRISI